MADEGGTTPAPTGIDEVLQDIATKFSSRFPTFRCLICNNEQFEIMNDGENGYLSRYQLFRDRSDEDSSFARTIGLACNNCGYIYSFAHEVLLRRLEEE